VLAVVTTLLFGLLIFQVSFNTLPWLSPTTASETLILYALSTINFLAFLVLLMVLVRSLIKLRRERQEQRLGARFKTRMVIFFVALSLLPVLFLFLATYGLINRSVDKWFSLPASIMVKNARELQAAYVADKQEDLQRTAITIARFASRHEDTLANGTLAAEFESQSLVRAELYRPDGSLIARRASTDENLLTEEFSQAWQKAREAASSGHIYAHQVTQGFKPVQLIAAAPVERGGFLIIAREVPPELAERANEINRQDVEYDRLKDNQRLYKQNALLALALVTLLVLFIATWMALYVARTVAGPVQQLAEATARIRHGDLSFRTDITSNDELATLAVSFNEMTTELFQNRRRLEESASDLQASNAALDERRRYTEAVLESLSAGVISLDEHGRMTTINRAAVNLLRIEGVETGGIELEAVLPEEQREELRRMIRRAARLGSLARDVHLTLANQVQLHAAVTVTAFHDPNGQARGTVIVIEDLTELIEAQRRAAWSEVARRMAHEIRNPLTPIRLSAERLVKNLLLPDSDFAFRSDRSVRSQPVKPHLRLDDRQADLVRECTSTISAEVATLQRMVDEFSAFARLPSAKPVPASINEIAQSALKLYDERLDGITIETRFAQSLPLVLADSEQIKRVLVNLIDNAGEALATSKAASRKIWVETREEIDRDVVQIIVADNGPGIPAASRSMIFEPYFSTRKRGTGLGLAIVSRIIAEHHGRIRVVDNLPHGVRFVVELPSARQMESAVAS
jgi:two-component system, NtrC family, nitrogen regulation sensor histidine kinase NtrY